MKQFWVEFHDKFRIKNKYVNVASTWNIGMVYVQNKFKIRSESFVYSVHVLGRR